METFQLHLATAVILFTLPWLHATDIAVNEETGMDKFSCLVGKVPCATLDFLFSNLPDCHGHPLNVTIHDGNFKFTFNSTVTNSLFKNCPSVSITGSGADKTSIICGKDVGFSFNGLISVKLANIKFNKCGSIQKHKAIDVASYMDQGTEPLFRIVLYFANCKDVTISNVLLLNHDNAALVVDKIYGSLLIEKSAIFDDQNILPLSVAADVACCDHGKIGENCVMQKHLNFYSNVNGTPLFNMSSYFSLDNSRSVLIAFDEYISNNTISIDNCRFYDAFWDGGLLVSLRNVYNYKSSEVIDNISPLNVNTTENNKDEICPPGYYLTSNGTCQCSFLNDKQQLNGILSCNNDRHAAKIKRGYWAGYRLSKQHPTPKYTNLVTGQCPRHYCSKMKTILQNFLPNISNITILDDLVCSPFNRTGTLCGRCVEGFAVAVNSPYYDCVNCSSWLSKHGWIILILTEYVPFTFLFSILLFFDVDLNSGSISSIILYFQVFDSLNIYSDDNIDQLGDNNKILKGISFLYNIWNLEFFGIFLPPYCISCNFNTMDILAIKYISGYYALLLFMLFTTVFSVVRVNLCGLEKIVRVCCLRLKFFITRQGSIVRGLATVWTLVIAKLTLISGLMLSREDLKGSKASQLALPVAWLQGNMDWGGDEHRVYVIVSFLVLLFFVFVPVSGLLCFPLVQQITRKIHERTGVDLSQYIIYNFIAGFLRLFSKFKPLIDSIQASCRQNCEFFAGLLYCYRFAIIFVFSFTIREETFFFNAAVSMTFVIITLLVQPYREQRDNIVTILCVSNIIFINLISTYLLYYSDTAPDSNYSNMQLLLVLQLILVLLPFAYFMVFAISRSMKKLKACWRQERVEPPAQQYPPIQELPEDGSVSSDHDLSD
ncbi:uncharacterized protein [Dysidea avara]|uniref:uncharacterized protein n=1 Tax=Dysidea avara TaxID=196820 RepID=UPI00332B72E9